MAFLPFSQSAGAIDAFGRQRSAGPHTIFDSKLLYDAAPLLWDESQTSGTGTSTSHSSDRASVIMSVAASTAGTRVRQTYIRHNYQPGKSQLILMTGVMGTGASGITRRIGYFDDDNGLFFEHNGTNLRVVRRSSVTGTAVDTAVNQSSWSVDTMDGNGPSGITLDLSKGQIFYIDFEWLGVGKVRFGFVIDGETYIVHELNNANNLTSVYMSTPNCPLRYEISNSGTGGAASIEHICSTVISEGGQNPIGTLGYASTDGTHVDANTANTIYAVVGLRLKSTHLGGRVDPLGVSMIAETADDFEWMLIRDPTVAGTFTYSNLSTDSCVQVARGATANTVTGGTRLAGGYAAEFSALNVATGVDDVALKLGAAINGTQTTLVLCARPLSSNLDIQGAITFREVQ